MAVSSSSFLVGPTPEPVKPLPPAEPITPTVSVAENKLFDFSGFTALSDYQEKSSIIVRAQFEGLHRYPNAPAGVEFLKSEHRHIFHVEAEIAVTHEDRELEFLLVKRWLNGLFDNGQMDHKSCEMIAHDIANAIVNRYGERNVKVSVFEDNENGGVYERQYKKSV